MTHKQKPLSDLLKENSDLDLLSTGDALKVVRKWVIAMPSRAMIFEKDGFAVNLVSKRELLDAISVPNESPCLTCSNAADNCTVGDDSCSLGDNPERTANLDFKTNNSKEIMEKGVSNPTPKGGIANAPSKTNSGKPT